MPLQDEVIRQSLAALARQRGADASFCPSEAARALADDWRPLMPEVRRMAAAMPEIEATQGGRVVDPTGATGPIRLRLKRGRPV